MNSSFLKVSVTKRQLPRPKEKPRPTQKMPAVKEEKEIIEDLKREKHFLKKRVAELEEKITKLENKFYALRKTMTFVQLRINGKNDLDNI